MTLATDSAALTRHPHALFLAMNLTLSQLFLELPCREPLGTPGQELFFYTHQLRVVVG